jgi:P-type Ca2+ transporter type 2C
VLTGESLPVSKGVEPVEAAEAPLGDRTDMVYMNTNVTRGTGEFVVTATGMATEVGHISGMLQRQDESKSPLTVQLEKLTKQLVTIAALALVASVAINRAGRASPRSSPWPWRSRSPPSRPGFPPW